VAYSVKWKKQAEQQLNDEMERDKFDAQPMRNCYTRPPPPPPPITRPISKLAASDSFQLTVKMPPHCIPCHISCTETEWRSYSNVQQTENSRLKSDALITGRHSTISLVENELSGAFLDKAAN
jgi:hypothetical protein